jgi:hypothetical protein
MKKFLLFFAVISLIASNAMAQLEKGNIMVGVTSTAMLQGGWGSEIGSLGFSGSKYEPNTENEEAYNETSYNLLPKGGYFIIDNLAAGLEVVISGYTEKYKNEDGKWSESLLGVGPFVRYYYPLDKIYPFAEVEALFGRYKDKWPTSGGTYEEEKNNFNVLGIYLGAALPLGDKVTFDMQAGYVRSSFKFPASGEGEDSFEIANGLGIKMGFTIYLRP